MNIFSPVQSSTQEHLDIEDIRDDMVVLRNASIGVVIGTSAINFELLSGGEQDANIFTFANLLNSINFPIQIVIRTVSTDVSGYVNQLESYKQTIGGTPLAAQVDIYKEFISNLTDNTNILDKSFFLVIPTRAFEAVRTSGIRQLFGQKTRIVNVQSLILRAKAELDPKRDHVLKQFAAMGLQAWQLKTDELIKLYYSIYDPDKRGNNILSIKDEDITTGMINPTAAPEEQPVAEQPK